MLNLGPSIAAYPLGSKIVLYVVVYLSLLKSIILIELSESRHTISLV